MTPFDILTIVLASFVAGSLALGVSSFWAPSTRRPIF